MHTENEETIARVIDFRNKILFCIFATSEELKELSKNIGNEQKIFEFKYDK